MTVEEVIARIRHFSISERKELMVALEDSLHEEYAGDRKHSIMDLKGLGADLWEGIDPQEYVNQLSDEWDDRKW